MEYSGAVAFPIASKYFQSIAITLIVLDIDVPEADKGSSTRSLAHLLRHQYDEYLAFLYSASALAILWMVLSASSLKTLTRLLGEQ